MCGGGEGLCGVAVGGGWLEWRDDEMGLLRLVVGWWMCRCNGEHGVRSRTGKNHVWHHGAATTRAAACPPRLNTAIARAPLV